jgi:hypothetical protein
MARSYASTRLKNDVIHMKNGDVITCEIRSLEQGQLTIKQDYATSTVVLDWKEVDHIDTKQPFVVVDTKGRAFSGALSETAKEHLVRTTGDDKVAIPHDDVVSIEQTGETFIRPLHGDVDIGLNFAKSNAQKNLTRETDLTYQATKHIFLLNSSSQFTSQQETKNTSETTSRPNISYNCEGQTGMQAGLQIFFQAPSNRLACGPHSAVRLRSDRFIQIRRLFRLLGLWRTPRNRMHRTPHPRQAPAVLTQPAQYSFRHFVLIPRASTPLYGSTQA